MADGLVADCYRLPAAEEVTTRELGRLGLVDWTVTSERGEADGTDTCTHFYLEPAQQRVVLVPLSDVVPPADEPIALFARHLGQALNDECLNTSDAATVARDAAADAGLTDAQLEIHEVSDSAADCTRTDVVVGGLVSVTLRGPAA